MLLDKRYREQYLVKGKITLSPLHLWRSLQCPL
jgi:hypothetical protein